MEVSKERVQLLHDGRPEPGCQPGPLRRAPAHARGTQGGHQAMVLKLELHQNHLEGWSKSRLLSPTPEFFIEFFWEGPEKVHP